MWELIESNRRKSTLLFVIMGLCLVTLGFLVGKTFFYDNGGLWGIFIAVMIWSFLSILSYFSGSSIMLAVSNAKEVTPDVHQQLFNVVEEMKIAAGLTSMPKVYIINSPAPNAFATGRDPDNCAIAVTAGLLAQLNRDELQGVIAHETSHIINRDVRFITFAGVMIGAIVIISEVFLRGLWFTGGSSRRYSSKSSGGGQIQMILMIVAIVFAILAPILARLLYFAISRKREYLADASAARLTRYPEGLASALEKISASSADLKSANKVTAPMFIVNPLKEKGSVVQNLTSTHPPIRERIRILRSMSGSNYIDYQKAYTSINNKNDNLIPASGLADNVKIDIRSASAFTEPVESVKTQRRELGDIMMAVNDYSFIQCECGLRIKIPQGIKKNGIRCPKCGRIHKVPDRNFR
jgi:heat shock protein HtpX